MKQLHIASLLLPFATGWIANINASPTSLVPRSRNIAGGLLDLIDKLQGGDTDAWVTPAATSDLSRNAIHTDYY